MKNISTHSSGHEKALLAQLTELPTELTPSRDLWPEIEQQLNVRAVNPQFTKTNNLNWMPLALAVSLLISFITVWFSWSYLQAAKQLYADHQYEISLDKSDDIKLQIKAMEQEYGLAKSALLAQIGMNSAKTNQDLLSDVKSHLIIIEQATRELKSAISQQPENPSLVKLLKTTYQQELVVLTKLARLKQDS